MIQSAIAAKLKQRAMADFKGRYYEAARIVQATVQGFKAMLWLREGFGFVGAWTFRGQNRLLGRCFELQAVNKT